MRTKLSLVFFISLVGLLFSSFVEDGLKVGDTAPDFKLKNLPILFAVVGGGKTGWKLVDTFWGEETKNNLTNPIESAQPSIEIRRGASL